MYSNVDSMIMNIVVKEVPQSRWPAPNVQEIQLSSLSDPVYDSCRLFQSEMRLHIVQVFLDPKIPLVVSVARLFHEVLSFGAEYRLHQSKTSSNSAPIRMRKNHVQVTVDPLPVHNSLLGMTGTCEYRGTVRRIFTCLLNGNKARWLRRRAARKSSDKIDVKRFLSHDIKEHPTIRNEE